MKLFFDASKAENPKTSLIKENSKLQTSQALMNFFQAADLAEINFLVSKKTSKIDNLINLCGQHLKFSITSNDELDRLDSHQNLINILGDFYTLREILKHIQREPDLLVNGKFLIISEGQAIKDIMSLLTNFEKLIRINNMKIYLLLTFRDEKLELKSTEFFSEVACKKLQMTSLSTFDMKTSTWTVKLSKNMFGNTKNYHGCTLICGVVNSIFVTRTKKSYEGVGVEIVKKMAILGNFSVGLKFISNKDFRGTDLNLIPKLEGNRMSHFVPASPLIKFDYLFLVSKAETLGMAEVRILTIKLNFLN